MVDFHRDTIALDSKVWAALPSFVISEMYLSPGTLENPEGVMLGSDTIGHSDRVEALATSFGGICGLSGPYLKLISYGAQVHDIGKASVERVISYEGALTGDQQLAVQMHTRLGYAMLAGQDELVRLVALYHHEKWGGGGYPDGLEGEEIPFPARLVAIADVFDALRSNRSYREALSPEEALHIMRFGDERLPEDSLDPVLMDIFEDHYDHFVKMHDRLTGDQQATALDISPSEPTGQPYNNNLNQPVLHVA